MLWRMIICLSEQSSSTAHKSYLSYQLCCHRWDMTHQDMQAISDISRSDSREDVRSSNFHPRLCWFHIENGEQTLCIWCIWWLWKTLHQCMLQLNSSACMGWGGGGDFITERMCYYMAFQVQRCGGCCRRVDREFSSTSLQMVFNALQMLFHLKRA